MKVNKFLMAAGLAITFASCSSNEDIDPTQNVAEQGDAYIAFSFNITNPGSRTFVNKAKETGTAEENAITSAKVFVFDDAGEVETTLNYAVNDSKTTDAQAVKAGEKTVYVVTGNVPAEVAAFESAAAQPGQSAIDRLEATLFATDAIAQTSKFTMFGKTTINPVARTKEQALADPFQVDVTRASAKAVLELNATLEYSPNLDATLSTAADNVALHIVQPAKTMRTVADVKLASALTAYPRSASVADLAFTKSAYMPESFVGQEGGANKRPMTDNCTFNIIRAKLVPTSISPAADGSFWALGKKHPETGNVNYYQENGKIKYFDHAPTGGEIVAGYEVCKFEKGYSYYRIPFENNNASYNSPVPDEYNIKFNVNRNTSYHIIVDGIFALGTPTPHDVVPTDPQPWEGELFVAFSISVLDWVKNTQTEKLQ